MSNDLTMKIITEKIKSLGLDLNKIPEKFKQFESLNYRPSRNYDERSYKTYRYVDINDIQILLTPKRRLDDINVKYAKALPLVAYLVPDKETHIETHAEFLALVKDLEPDSIKRLEAEQKIVSKKIPFTVKYHNDYLWQIHYSESADKYFMLVPTEEQDQSAFFYLMKKQLENKKQEKIFVPICYSEYSGEYLRKSEMEELEKYIWFFTKKWPIICDVYDEKDKLSLCITSKAVIYEDMVSDYCIKLTNKEEAIKFYKLIKALFILQTELAHYYKFDIRLDKKGAVEFYFNKKLDEKGQIDLYFSQQLEEEGQLEIKYSNSTNQTITYENSLEFIKQECLKVEKAEKSIKKDKKKLEKKLSDIKLETAQLDLEYLNKEREIAVYLDCKRTFFGKVKFYFTKKKKNNNVDEVAENEEQLQEDKKTKEEEKRTKSNEKKDFYTIEDLIERYKDLDQDINYIKDAKLDIDAGTHRNKNMKLKVKNATLFLEEIDSHTKSIFSFWKYANKDKIEQLAEGQTEEKQEQKLKKTFNYELDIEDFSTDIDRRQRKNLSKEEINSIFIATTDIIADINKVADGENITAKRLEELKKQIIEEKKLLDGDQFDIFGNVTSDSTKLNTLANKKHREIKKEKNRMLDINRNTDNKEYQDYIDKIVKNIQYSFKKSCFGLELPIYCVTTKKELDKRFNIFNLNSVNIMHEIEAIDEKEKITLYRFNLKENSPAIALSNIIYYDNNNQTLPLGMNETQGVLIDKFLLDLGLKNKREIRLVCYKEDDSSDVIIKTINVEEYDVR